MKDEAPPPNVEHVLLRLAALEAEMDAQKAEKNALKAVVKAANCQIRLLQAELADAKNAIQCLKNKK